MPPVSTAQLKKVLNQLDISDLRVFARNENLEIPDGSSKDEIVASLIDSRSGAISDQLRNAVKLELTTAQQVIREEIAQQTKSSSEKAENNIRAHTSQEFERIKGWRETTSASLSNLQLMIRATVAGVGLIAIVGGFFGIKNVWQTTDEIKNLREKMIALNAELTSSLANQQILFNAYSGYISNEFQFDLDQIMDSFTLSGPDEKLLERVGGHRRSLEKLIKMSGSGAVDKERHEVFSLLYEFYENLQNIRRIISSAPQTGIKQELNLAEGNWKSIHIPKVTIGDPQLQFKMKARAFKYNVLGIISLQKFKRLDPQLESDLDNAASLYKQAVSEAPEFGRSYANIGVVLNYRYHLELKKLRADNRTNIADLRRILKEAREITDKGIRAMRNKEHESGAWNNKAYLYLAEANLLSDFGDLESARDMLRHADKSISVAQSYSQVRAVSFLTRAEIECFRIELEKASVSGMNAEQKTETLRRILDLVSRGVRSGWRLPGGINRQNFLKEFSFFVSLDHLGLDYSNDLFEAAGVAS